MTTIDVHVPLRLRLVGELTDAEWQQLEDVLTRSFARAFRLDPAPPAADAEGR